MELQEVREDLAVARVRGAMEGRVSAQVRKVEARGVMGQQDLIVIEGRGDRGEKMDRENYPINRCALSELKVEGIMMTSPTHLDYF